MAVTGSIKVDVNLIDARSADLESAVNTLAKAFAWNVANGVGSNQADRIYADTRTLSASASEALDLTALANLYGSVSFAKVKAVIVLADGANVNNVQVIRTATTGALLFMADGDGIEVRPGGIFAWVAPGTGFTVTDTSDDTITVTNSAGGSSVTYTIIVVGTSA